MPLVLISVILRLDLASRKKQTIFLNLSNETHSVPKFQLNTLRVQEAFCINWYLLKVPTQINEQRFSSKQGVQLFQYRRC